MNIINPQWTAYNNINNEGGEGFNPHSQYMSHDDSEEPLWSILEEKQYRLQCKANGMSMDNPKYMALLQEIKELNSAIEIAKS